MAATPLHIVTDSTCNLPAELLELHRIATVPVVVMFGADSYREGVDITLPAFYERVERTGEVPKASQPPPGAFVQVYQTLASQGGQILSVHLTGRLSGVLTSARLASEMVPQADVALFDSRSCSIGLGFCVLEAARMAEAGANRDAIVARLEQVRDRMSLIMTPATLRYLQNSGRVGRLQGAVAGLLDLKPIIACQDGLLEVVAKVRSRRGSLDSLLDLTEDSVGKSDPVNLAVIHANVPKEAEVLAAEARRRFNIREMFVETLSLALGAHCGPGGIGIVAYRV